MSDLIAGHESAVESATTNAAGYIPLQVIVREAGGDESHVFENQNIEAEKMFSTLTALLSKEKPSSVATGYRVLMTGIPGVGKSTMLKHWCSEWSNNNLWRGKFDYVFNVKLKLISGDWKFPYGEHFDLYPLQCFLHHCLVDEAGGVAATGISVEEILAIEDLDKMLLLLDGYDEIAHLASDRSMLEFQILRDVFKYKNVLTTARPNSVDKQTERFFDRKTENIGIDNPSVHQYVQRRFGNQPDLGKDLLSFLASNTQVLDICKVPIWSDPHARSRFDQNFKVGTLYQQIVVWLGKRYLLKFKVDTPMMILPGGEAAVSEQAVLSTKEVLFQLSVAYGAFNSGSEQWYQVSSLMVRHTLNSMKFLDKEAAIGDVCKYGLLRPVKKTTDLLEQDFAFFHLTFQEYLAAHHLKDDLLSCEPTRVTAAADFPTRATSWCSRCSPAWSAASAPPPPKPRPPWCSASGPRLCATSTG